MEIGTPAVGFFDQYTLFQVTSHTSTTLNRLNKRYRAIIEPHRELIRGARVLDLASHDGRWSFAALKAGAFMVTGIEAREELVASAEETMRAYSVASDAYDFIRGDVLDVMRTQHIQADGVLLLGYFYHVWRQVELVQQIARTGANWVVVDTALLSDAHVSVAAPNVVEMRVEGTEEERNQMIADRGDEAIVGYPSRQAVKFLFDQFGYDSAEYDWPSLLADGAHDDVSDYVNGDRTTFLMTRR